MPLGSPDRMDGATGIGFFENGHNLRFGELRLAHGTLPATVTIVPESSPYGRSQSRGSVRVLIELGQLLYQGLH